MGLLEDAGIRVPKYRVAESVDQVYQIASSKGMIFIVAFVSNILL
jgi:hypothetical protein